MVIVGCSVNVVLSFMVVVKLVVRLLCVFMNVGLLIVLIVLRLLVVLCWMMNMKCLVVVVCVNVIWGVNRFFSMLSVLVVRME